MKKVFIVFCGVALGTAGAFAHNHATRVTPVNLWAQVPGGSCVQITTVANAVSGAFTSSPGTGAIQASIPNRNTGVVRELYSVAGCGPTVRVYFNL